MGRNAFVVLAVWLRRLRLAVSLQTLNLPPSSDQSLSKEHTLEQPAMFVVDANGATFARYVQNELR